MNEEQNKKMHLVAIIKPVERFYDYDSHDTIINSISEWEEVDDETFKLLKNASSYVTNYSADNRFIVLERLTTHSPVVINTVAAYVDHISKEKAKRDAETAAKKAKAEARLLAKVAKDEKARMALYEQLQAEFGESKPNGT